MLDNFEGWKPGKNGPSKAWTRLQEHYVPDYNQRIGKVVKNKTKAGNQFNKKKGCFLAYQKSSTISIQSMRLL